MSTLQRKQDSGMAMVLTLMACIILVGGTFLMYMLAQNTFQQTEQSIDQVRAEEAAKAGVDLGIYTYWGTYLASRGGSPGNMASFIQYVANLLPNNEDLNGNGQKDAGEVDANMNGTFEVAQPVAIVASNNPKMLDTDVSIASLTAIRTNDATGTTITLRSTGSAAGLAQTIEQNHPCLRKTLSGF